METRIGVFDHVLAKALGLTLKQVPFDPCSYSMPRRDWALYDAVLNPGSKVSVRYVKNAGFDVAYVGRCSLRHLQDSTLDDLAWRVPHLPHVNLWARQLLGKPTSLDRFGPA